jgi:hypothetical protein
MNFGQTIWDKTQVQLGTSWGMRLGTLLGTWELFGNLSLPLPPFKKKEKETGLFMSAC